MNGADRQGSGPPRAGSDVDLSTDRLDAGDLITLSYNAAAIRARISPEELQRIHDEIQRRETPDMDVESLHTGDDDGTTAIGLNPATRIMQVRDRMESQEYGEALRALEELLTEEPQHGTAQFLAGQCRGYLTSLYSLHFADRSAVPRVQVRLADLSDRPVRTRAAFLVSRIDGATSIEEIIDVAGMPELEVLHTLYELESGGVVRIERAR